MMAFFMVSILTPCALVFLTWIASQSPILDELAEDAPTFAETFATAYTRTSAVAGSVAIGGGLCLQIAGAHALAVTAGAVFVSVVVAMPVVLAVCYGLHVATINARPKTIFI